MTSDATALAPPGTATTARPSTRPSARHRHPRLVLALLAAVVLVDQGTKWWAWRHLPGAFINPGGNDLVGHEISAWYSSQLSGAVLDVQSTLVLGLAVWLLVRVPQRLLAGPAALAVGGWSSNALDRLGLHFWTAPGSVRGAVDFIPFHHCVYNVADFAIAGGTVFLLAAVGYALFTRRGRHGLRPASAHRRRRRPFARLALAGAASGLVAAAAFGAMHDTGVKSPVADRGSTMVRAR